MLSEEGEELTGDGARRDADGYYWITGRVDDVLNVSGHRLGTAEVEGALVSHPFCSEAAVIGFPHEVKGEGLLPGYPKPGRERSCVASLEKLQPRIQPIWGISQHLPIR